MSKDDPLTQDREMQTAIEAAKDAAIQTVSDNTDGSLADSMRAYRGLSLLLLGCAFSLVSKKKFPSPAAYAAADAVEKIAGDAFPGDENELERAKVMLAVAKEAADMAMSDAENIARYDVETPEAEPAE